MSAHSLIEIPFEKWADLRDLYIGHKTSPMGYNMLQNFISWHEQNNENVKIYALDGDWQMDGTFLLLLEFEFQTQVYANTLFDDLQRLTQAYQCLDTGKCYNFYAIPERLTAAAEAYIQSRQMTELVRKDKTYWYHATKHVVDGFSDDIPEGITLAKLNVQYAAQINEVWPHRGQGSIQFVESLIRYNASVGAFDEAGNLIAWSLILPVASIGLLQVVEQHKRRGLGGIMIRHISKKISQMGMDVMAPVVCSNVASRSLFEKLGFRPIDNANWYMIPASKIKVNSMPNEI